MNLRKSLCVLALSAGLLSPMTAFAKAKDYQVTGPIVSVEKHVVTIMKGDEKWEIDLDDATKIEGKLEVGQKVTIHYHMVADKVDQKADDKK
jgi:hypothetical protein